MTTSNLSFECSDIFGTGNMQETLFVKRERSHPDVNSYCTNMDIPVDSNDMSKDSSYCSRCRNFKKTKYFLDGNICRKTCLSCREYGKKYIKRKLLSRVNMLDNGDPNNFSSSEDAYYTDSEPFVKHYIPSSDFLLCLDNRRFLSNMRWMFTYIECNIDNHSHISRLNYAFGRYINNVRETIEADLCSIKRSDRL